MPDPRIPVSEGGKKILAEVSELAAPPVGVDNSLSNCKRVWEAFAFGEAYERLWVAEHDKKQNRCSDEAHALKRMGGFSVCPDCHDNIYPQP